MRYIQRSSRRLSWFCRESAVMTDARLAPHFLWDSGNGVRADLDIRAPARFGKSPQPCEHAVVRLSADGAFGITTHHRTGHGVHMRPDVTLRGGAHLRRISLERRVGRSSWRWLLPLKLVLRFLKSLLGFISFKLDVESMVVLVPHLPV